MVEGKFDVSVTKSWNLKWNSKANINGIESKEGERVSVMSPMGKFDGIIEMEEVEGTVQEQLQSQRCSASDEFDSQHYHEVADSTQNHQNMQESEG